MSISPAVFDAVKSRLAVPRETKSTTTINTTQQNLLAAQHVGAAHHLAVEWRFLTIDPERLQTALQEIVTRHDALRMCFGADGMRIERDCKILLTRCASHAERDAFCFSPFDIEKAPLMRVALVDEAMPTVWLCWHHLVFDGWSYQVFVEELAQLYAGHALPQATPWTTAAALRTAPRLPVVAPVDFGTGNWVVWPRPLRRLRASLIATDAVAVAARQLEIGLFEWLLASLALLFSRLGDAQSVRFQIADADRARAPRVIGPSTRRVGVAIDIDDAKPFAAVAAATSLSLSEALKSDGDDNLPASALIAFQNQPQADAWPSLIRAEALPAPHIVADHVITLQVQGASINVLWDTASDTISETTAMHLLASWRRCVAQLLEGRAPKDLDWCDTAIDLPSPALIPALSARFARVVAERADAPALLCGDIAISYRELDQRTLALMQRIARAGIQAGQPVLVDIAASDHYLIAIVALARFGAIYVPCDAQHPRRLVQSWDGRLAAALTHDNDWQIELIDSQADIDLRGGYRMYTSGSTGAPKPARISERSIVQLALMHGVTAVRAEDRVAMIAPVGFDASTFEIWAALLNGATLVASRDVLTAASLAELIERQRISVAFLGSGWFELLVDFHISSLGRMRLVLSGGEVMSPAHAARFLAALPDVQLANVYGPTENTTFTTAKLVTEVTTPIALGTALPGRTVFLLDRCGHLVPPGVAAEAWLGGDGVMLASAAETRVSMHPQFGALYRSGDRMWSEHGELFFAGRKDRQVKWRGFRVHLDHVEAALRSDATVRSARVRLMREPDVRLVAEVELRDGTQLADLRQRMAERWPATMLPSDYRLLTATMLPSGKAQRTLIEVPEAAPEMPFEADVLRVFREALSPVSIDAEQDFYERGGHSLLALRVLAELERRLSLRIEIAEFNAAPNARALAARLTQAESIDETSLFVELTGTTFGHGAFVIPGGHGGDAELALYRTALGSLPIRLIGVRIVDIQADSLSARAVALAARIEAHAPAGPLRLIGECIGGVLAQDVARQLGGRDVALLLLDTWPMTDAGFRHYQEQVRPLQLKREATRLKWLALADLWRVSVAHCNWSLWHSRYRKDVVETIRRVANDWRALIASIGMPRSESEQRGADVMAQALAHRTQAGPALSLIAPAHSRQHQVAAAWAPLATVREYPVPGHHANYLRRHAAATRAALRSWWEELQT